MENTDLEKISQLENTSKKEGSYSYSDSDKEFVFLTKKTEKLASAVYLITNLFLDSEPMKWTLRKKVSDLLSFVVTYKDIRQSELPNFIHISKTRVSEIVSLLEVSHLGGLISLMNFNILKQEFSNLIDTMNSTSQKSDFSNSLISDAFFESVSHTNVLPINSHQNILKDTPSVKDTGQFKSNNRQSIILTLLKKKKELTIKDIAAVIKEVSEKTIQRELISLISAGIISKTGERRWSKYSLVNKS